MTIELTKDDIKNGWTPESLEKYHQDRLKTTMKVISESRVPSKPDVQGRYDPLKWRE